MGRAETHACHALGCRVKTPPAMLMHRGHWFMVPPALRRAVLAAYRPGQERRMDPSVEYLLTAAAAVKAVALKEGMTPEAIHADAEYAGYLAWADMIQPGASMDAPNYEATG